MNSPTTLAEGARDDLIARARALAEHREYPCVEIDRDDLLALIARLQSAEFALRRHYEQDISFGDRQAFARAHFTTYSENSDG